jgi:hypothetical protein
MSEPIPNSHKIRIKSGSPKELVPEKILPFSVIVEKELIVCLIGKIS